VVRAFCEDGPEGSIIAIGVELSADLERDLRGRLRNLDPEVKEALLVALYRQRKLSHVALANGLGLDRFETARCGLG
jgi:hypothetical protein